MRGFFFIMFDLFFYVMFGFNPGISFTDSRAKHGNDRGEETNTATIEEKKNKSGNDKL